MQGEYKKRDISGFTREQRVRHLAVYGRSTMYVYQAAPERPEKELTIKINHPMRDQNTKDCIGSTH
jgi:hypothetical protein